MPSAKPAPRRASGAGRAPGAGRRDATAPRPGAPRRGESQGSPSRRPARDGAERRIDRATSSARPPSRGPRREYDDQDRTGRPSSSRSSDNRPDRGDRDRRPRSQNAARPDVHPGSRDVRPSGPRRGSGATGQRARGEERFDRDDRDRRPRSAGAGASRSYADRNAQRPIRDEGGARRPLDRRPSAPPRSGRGSTTDRPRFSSNTRGSNRAPRDLTPEELERQKANTYGQKKGWGGVARRGAVSIRSEGPAMESTPSAGYTPDPLSEWVQEVRVTKSSIPTKAKAKVKYALPGDVAADVRKAFIGTAYMREKMVATLTRAAEAYDRKRYEEALRLGRTVADATPGVAPVRELTGLAAYRAERWSMAKIHLKAHFTITGDPEHLPLIMDCDRANRRYRAVEKDFAQLEESEPTAEVLVEGRIVMASALADQQMYTEAIELLTRAGGTKQLRNPSFRHVRLWYALADIYDRAGDVVSARELFARVVIAEPEAYDANARLAELGASAPSKNRKRRTTPISKKKID
jgi:hypothetical protein